MPNLPWIEPSILGDSVLTPWTPATDVEAKLIEREALRYCPEFPFKPDRQQIFQKQLACYQDYRLVYFAAVEDEKSPQRGVYGFYAPGDFRPVEWFGKTFQWLNQFVPIQASSETILDYALTRLRFELPHILHYLDTISALGQKSIEPQLAERLIQAFGIDAVNRVVHDVDEQGEKDKETIADRVEAAFEHGYLNAKHHQLELARIAVTPEDLFSGKAKTDEPWADFLRSPQVELDEGKSYKISCTATLKQPENKEKLVQVSASFEQDGTLNWSAVKCTAHDSLIETTKPESFAVSPLRANTAIPIQKWHSLADHNYSRIDASRIQNKIGSDNALWHRALKDQYGVGKSVEVHESILRVADLSFYRTFCLLEVQERLKTTYRRSYALIRLHQEQLDIRPLNGTSPVLHKINEEEDKPEINGDGGEDYLRFFCWAVHGPEGPFNIVRTLREIPFAALANREQLNSVRAFLDPSTNEFPLKKLPPETTEGDPPRKDSPRKTAFVLYATALFEADFTIPPTGFVAMDRDEPKLGELNLAIESYGKGDLFILSKPGGPIVNPGDDDLPPPKHYLEAGKDGEPQPISQNVEDKPVMEAAEFQGHLGKQSGLAQAEITEAVVIDDGFFQGHEGDEKTS